MVTRLLTGRVEKDRYHGRPFLRVLECYVLWAVGELTPHDAQALEDLTPKLQATYGKTATWQEIVEQEMQFADEVASALRTMWLRNVAARESAGESIDPDAWAKEVVDSNFT